MADSLIQEDETLASNYGSLLVRAREIDVQEESGQSICCWCSSNKAKHLPDRRCSCSSLSREFVSTRKEERARIDKALKLIEELRTI